ncbi:LysR family transcriptional regulator [Paraburkholderia tropica]|uniref:DNA-binding transcriptional regulator, LysR family n=1 Tax=Paraburkholderia tropica TaxID=92647 RepID=A0AAQ1JT13_9BURK|nr:MULTISPECIES: LysR family transcriptional regulator [Paraburkholderia]SEJ32436.1 DNA-binding transcriptional regulator, LysR family [Paraburkholderia tropica]
MRLLIQVVDAGSFTAAARASDMNTGAVSRAVSDLEKRLRTRLLNRSTRRLSLTAAGVRYVERCRAIVTSVDLAEDEASDAHLHPVGTLKVHTYTSIGRRYVLPAIQLYRESYPDVVVQLNCSQQMPDLFDGSCDVAIVAARALPNSDLVGHQIGSTHSVLCASREYLVKRGVPRLPADLRTHDCLTLEVAAPEAGLWVLDGPDGATEVSVNGVLQTNVSELIASGVKRGMGIGILPLFAAVDGLIDGSLVRVLPEFTLQQLNVFAIYPSRHFLDAKIKTWMDCLQSYVPDAIQREEIALLSQENRACAGTA